MTFCEFLFRIYAQLPATPIWVAKFFANILIIFSSRIVRLLLMLLRFDVSRHLTEKVLHEGGFWTYVS